ncbi:AAA family ATPase [Microbispora bryophytorum]|uniref:AAA family ATPase n=1 Tax=Microbispora bryophytorum TaxID=1460882 RepID=UPI0033ED2B90
MRLGARLRGGNGTTLEIVRTKGRKAPLQRPDGAPVSEADLLAMLGGIDRHTFATVFALTSAELRQGGRALVTGKGDLGQALSASRSGLSLTNALRDIEMRIGELFKRSASKPRINAQIALLKDARERKRSALLRPERYDTLEQEVAAAQGRFDRLTSEWTEALSTHSRLSRLQQALPALRKYRDLLARMATVSAEGIVAPVEVAERLPSLLKGLEDARRRDFPEHRPIAMVGAVRGVNRSRRVRGQTHTGGAIEHPPGTRGRPKLRDGPVLITVPGLAGQGIHATGEVAVQAPSRRPAPHEGPSIPPSISECRQGQYRDVRGDRQRRGGDRDGDLLYRGDVH